MRFEVKVFIVRERWTDSGSPFFIYWTDRDGVLITSSKREWHDPQVTPKDPEWTPDPWLIGGFVSKIIDRDQWEVVRLPYSNAINNHPFALKPV